MRFILFILLCLLIAFEGQAQTTQTYSEAEQMGVMAGLAYACGSTQKLKDFELIATQILANKSTSDEETNQKLQQFATTKYRYMKRQKDSPRMSCKEVLEHFNNMPIFQSTVYSDGTIKMYDGTWLKPKYKTIQIQMR